MSEEKLVYLYDNMGFFTGTTIAEPSPLESDVYLLPPNATLVAPPPGEEGKQARWNGSEWHNVTTQIGDSQVAINKLKDFLANNPDVAALLS